MDRLRDRVVQDVGVAKRENDRCARALAVADLFKQRSRAAAKQQAKAAAAKGVSAYLRGLIEACRLGIADNRARVYLGRLHVLPASQLSDRGLARFIFGHSDLGLTAPQRDEEPTPSSGSCGRRWTG